MNWSSECSGLQTQLHAALGAAEHLDEFSIPHAEVMPNNEVH
jgi:hypothetical protein